MSPHDVAPDDWKFRFVNLRGYQGTDKWVVLDHDRTTSRESDLPLLAIPEDAFYRNQQQLVNMKYKAGPSLSGLAKKLRENCIGFQWLKLDNVELLADAPADALLEQEAWPEWMQ